MLMRKTSRRSSEFLMKAMERCGFSVMIISLRSPEFFWIAIHLVPLRNYGPSLYRFALECGAPRTALDFLECGESLAVLEYFGLRQFIAALIYFGLRRVPAPLLISARLPSLVLPMCLYPSYEVQFNTSENNRTHTKAEKDTFHCLLQTYNSIKACLHGIYICFNHGEDE